MRSSKLKLILARARATPAAKRQVLATRSESGSLRFYYLSNQYENQYQYQNESTKMKMNSSNDTVQNRSDNNKTASAAATTSVRYKSTLAAAAVTTTMQQQKQQQLQQQQPFPSIVIGPNRSIEPQGSFAEAQAQFLDPDPEMVETLKQGLLKTNMGIVAHYYMDVELQGVLQALKHSHPELQHRIGIADSLKMGDLAVEMCRNHNVTSVVCLGVDFMSESVQAILHKNGLEDVPVYRATQRAIGCSLAESAEGDAYRAWLQQESAKATDDGHVPLHVIYINTSLETKAISSSIVPTITCTSSNVLQTLLQAAHDIGPTLRVLYGPDTYMGQNLVRLLQVILESPEWTDDKIASDLHDKHSNETLQILHDNLVVFPQGNCVVHHMFGAQVVETVQQDFYNDAFMTAHLEVPGEMFDIAMSKSLQDKGVVGSTSDILSFITRKVQEATTTTSLNSTSGDTNRRRLRFVLGTEAGMVTSIVKNVQDILGSAANGRNNTNGVTTTITTNNNTCSVEAEIIFPVSSEAVMTTDGTNDADLPIVPGVAGGEGCSTAGGCATCPFMKMNNLDALQDIIDMVDENSPKSSLQLHKHLPPDRLRGKSIGGVDATELGTEAILYMRKFMMGNGLPDELVKKVTSFGKS